MGSRGGIPRWNGSDYAKVIRTRPEALMAEIDSAISNLEYTQATLHIDRWSSSHLPKHSSSSSTMMPQYDARLADEAYKAGCAAMAVGKLDEALYSLNVSLSKCPPDKTFAVAKLQSLISLTSQQIRRSSN